MNAESTKVAASTSVTTQWEVTNACVKKASNFKPTRELVKVRIESVKAFQLHILKSVL